MLSISCGMMMIASLLGYNRTSECVVDSDDISTAKAALVAESSHVSSLESEENVLSFPLYTGEGAERYRYFQKGKHAVIYDARDKRVCYSGGAVPFSDYLAKEDGLPLYLPNCSKGEFAVASPKGIWELDSHCYLDKSDLLSSIDRQTLSSNGGTWQKINPETTVMKHRARNGFYFEKLLGSHGDNKIGTCGIVATQILFGYYDTFSNDKIVPEQYDVVSTESAKTIADFERSPATDRADSSNVFHDALIKFSADHGWNKTGTNTTVNDLRKLVDGYMNYTGVEHKIGWVEGNWSDIHSNACMNTIESSINAGRPVIVGAAGHAFVAYGYDDNYLYAHTGWGYVGRTPWSTIKTGPLHPNGHPFMIDVNSIPTHLHSDNYHVVSGAKNIYLCPCGHEMRRMNVSPWVFGFTGSSSDCYSGESTTIDQAEVLGIRHNSGYKDNRFFMQASGTATSCFRFTLTKPNTSTGLELRKAIVPFAAWSDSDYIADSECIFRAYYIERDLSSTILVDDILRDKDLPNNRYKMQNYTFDIPNGKVGIEFDFSLRSKTDTKMRTIAFDTMTFEYGGY